MKSTSAQLEADVLIIGGGPAGIQAARLLRSSQPDWRVAVVRPEDFSMVYCAIPYAIEGLFPLEKTLKKDDLLTGVGAELIRGAISRVDTKGHRAELQDGRSISYRKLLVATGAIPVKPPLPGMNGENVFTVKTEADARRIIARLALNAGCESDGSDSSPKQPAQKAIVIGAGAIGIEQATAYRAHKLEVHLVEMQDHVLPHLIDADMAAPIHQELEDLGIHLHLNTRLESLVGEPAVTGVCLAGEETISLDPKRDFVVVSVGMRPDIDFLGEDNFDRVADGLVVDEHMRTSVPDVWAAGDCVAYKSGIDGQALGGKLATNAVPMAKVAAKDMLGMAAAYPGFFNGAATVAGSLRIGGTGFTETFARSRGLQVASTEASTTARFPMMPAAGHVKIKLVIEEGSERIIGGQVVGTEAVAERIDLLTFAIQRGATASDLAELSYAAQPWQTFFPARNAIVEAAASVSSLSKAS